ncbi:hypothetical protein H310_06870 [Aphanomyces invadans]|uniref:Uncharacterized protein n=1 Tax=Aphanomyces invadans TaxID=157072 RepID=A0A024U4H4_9STRA|nr:hypothetical protein H310_06870 [Aphanomyces invadans]ETW01306.1 hypothetical protein H310_06870 [Aphanomyces invadans]|eukprot:XP_008870304.1 hypothetical protein H310_06870 [Aphanomyces invadans]
MACRDCQTKACHLCRRCITAHCTCGPVLVNPICLESKACDCITLSRCGRCRGCKPTKRRAIYHCNCAQHALGNCLCDSILVPEDNAHDNLMQKRRVRRRFSLPSVDNVYSARHSKQDLFESSAMYSLLRTKGGKILSHTDRDGRRGAHTMSYLASLERDRSKATEKKALRAKAPEYFDRAMDNATYTAEVESRMPSDGIVDYLVYTGSLKVANVPELLGTMDSSAAVAAAIVVEEFIRQEVEAFVEQKQQVPLVDEEALVGCIHELLNGARPTASLADSVTNELHRVFGKDALSAYDVKKMVEDELACATADDDNEERAQPESIQTWKASRVAKGIQELAQGAVHSEDGIYVTLVHGRPSYWFSAEVPDHGIVTSEGYSSYSQAWNTKLELEARVDAYNQGETATKDGDDMADDENVGGAKEVVEAVHHIQGVVVPLKTYFPNDQYMHRVLMRIALPIPETPATLAERMKRRLWKKIERARDEQERKKQQKQQETETMEHWLRRCVAEGRCPHCSGPCDHIDDSTATCQLWSHFQAKLASVDDRHRSFEDVAIEWFDERRDDAFDV